MATKCAVRLGRVDFTMSLSALRVEIFQAYASSSAKSCTSFAYPTEKRGMVLETILEPVILALKPDQHTRGFAVASDDYLAVRGEAQVA